MSPIGRIFIVLNLALAGGFVYFSGVYLQRATDWKDRHDKLQSTSAQQVEQQQGQIAAKDADLRDKERQLTASESNRNSLETQLQEAKAENQQLAKQLNTIQGELATQAANYSTISSSIDTSTKEYQEATKMAIQSGQTRDEAVRAMEVAKADLRDANDRIAALEASLGEGQAQNTALQQTIREKEVLIAAIQTKFPEILTQIQPKLSGTIQRIDADGKLLTVLITDDPTSSGAKPGYTFAVYAGSVYKGEALVTEVDRNFAFCRVIRSTGRKIEVGDQATTQTN